MGSKAKRKFKHRLNSKKYVSNSDYCRTYGAPKPAAGNISRKSKLYEALGSMERSNAEPRGSSCCSDINLVFHKMLPIPIISPHDFRTDPTRAIRTSRDSGTRSDELETLLFQSNIDEFIESSKRIGKESNINTTFFPTLLTETERIGQDLLQQLDFLNSHTHKLSEAYKRPDQPVRYKELSNTGSICDTSALSFTSQNDEQLTMEQKTDEEILNFYRPKTNTTESNREQYRVESPDRPVTQDNHEEREDDNMLDPVVDLMADRESTEDIEGAQVTKSKRKKPKKKKKKKKKKKSVEDLRTTTMMKIFGTKIGFDVTLEEKGIVDILNFYTEMSIEEFDDFERYIIFLEYHCFIITMLIKKPDGFTSLRSKFDLISPTILVHQFSTINHHFFQAVLYCIVLARRASETQRLQQYFNEFIEDNKHQKYNEAMLSESNDTIINYFRIMAENGSLHPVEWYKSLKEVSLNIQKTRPFPGSRPARDHWTDTLLCCTCCDEVMPFDPRVDSMISNYLEGSEDFKRRAWYHWLNTRRLPWINAISAFELNRTMESNPSP